MEVRCCCNAGKILGYLPNPPEGVKKMVFLSNGMPVEFEVAAITTVLGKLLGMENEIAYKSKDYPDAVLDAIPEFRRKI